MAAATKAKPKARKDSEKAADCCAPGPDPLDLAEQRRPEDEELAELAKAVCHPIRILIVRNLLRIGTCYFGKLADLLPVAPSTASQHLTVLKEAGVVKGEVEGERPCYCVDVTKLRRLQQLIGDL